MARRANKHVCLARRWSAFLTNSIRTVGTPTSFFDALHLFRMPCTTAVPGTNAHSRRLLGLEMEFAFTLEMLTSNTLNMLVYRFRRRLLVHESLTKKPTISPFLSPTEWQC